MRIELVLEGWDASFNAITELNGSGKSNILDAICFVLGITNIQQAAQNQQDLIYKHGQEGITKASVTVVFDNSDRSTSHAGLENSKQITLTRQVIPPAISLPNITKYILNGDKVQQQPILSLVQSVQLNINNPNFVIMRGITKEILGMMEEAAGTRIFEERKEKAKQTMRKKEKCIEWITSKTSSELERLARFLRAHDWTEANTCVDKKAVMVDAQREVDEGEREGAEAEKKHGRIKKKWGKELAKGGKSKALEVLSSHVEELVRLGTQLEIKEGTIVDEQKVKTLEQSLKELNQSLEAKHTDAANLTTSHGEQKEKHTQMLNKVATSEELLQTLVTGLSSNSNAPTAECCILIRQIPWHILEVCSDR
ncbi:hypothetical protein BS47DRAFT_1372846 [Hydnum rufescens UP504]|uniref:RecF/RecN/SMC N-terminal domain-containing protein n=1 Tax=Hydnum rufescens UP504 TaxID=1448309 RepID=A0A9P6DSK8_9AGAM|nr:hypothetical protein BS47DRAFT_1372846 [Hydnum rufescens UP504]